MLIPLQCPNCQTRLNVPQTMAGKRIQCLKCQTVVTVPQGTPASPSHGSQVAPPPAPRTAARPGEPPNIRNNPSAPSKLQPPQRPGPLPPPIPTPITLKPVAGSELNPWNLDEPTPTEQSPHRFTSESRSSVNPTLLLLVLGAATALLLLGSVGIVGAAWYFVGLPARDGVNDSKNDRQTATRTDTKAENRQVGKATIPTGWKKLEAPGARWTMYFPGNPVSDPINRDLDPRLPKIYSAMNIEQKVLCAISVIDLTVVHAPGREQAIEMCIKTMSRARLTEVSRKDTTLAGLPATEVVFDTDMQVPGGDKVGAGKPQSIARMLMTESAFYYLMITNGEPGRPKSEFENGFFDNFELIE